MHGGPWQRYLDRGVYSSPKCKPCEWILTEHHTEWIERLERQDLDRQTDPPLPSCHLRSQPTPVSLIHPLNERIPYQRYEGKTASRNNREALGHLDVSFFP